MKKTICLKCNDVMNEEYNGYEMEMKVFGICWECRMNPSWEGGYSDRLW